MPPEMTAPEATTSTDKGRVLVVDDELDIREGLETLLHLEGYSVDLAANGTEGLRKIESRAYDMVLLDLMMPDRSGMDVLRDVRGRDRETPIFMITAYGSVEAAVEALKLGANDGPTPPRSGRGARARRRRAGGGGGGGLGGPRGLGGAPTPTGPPPRPQ